MTMQEYLASHDIERSDIGPFLFIHTVLSAILVGSTWGICYVAGKNPPVQSFLTTNSVLLNFIKKMPVISVRLKAKACQAMSSLEQSSRNSRIVRYIEQKIPSVDATLLCVSYAEAKFGRLFLKPVTVPGRIWLSLKGAKLWKRLNSCNKGLVKYDAQAMFASKKKNEMQSSFVGAKSNAIFCRELQHVNEYMNIFGGKCHITLR